jgi:preprotein translocase subunit SecD
MQSKNLVWSLAAIVAIAILSIGATVLTGKTPLLGLDLKGGVSVVERPTGSVNQSKLQEAVNIMDRRVDGIGVSNSIVNVQGQDIVIELPGAKNDTQVLKVIGQTAQLFFRPVECLIAPYLSTAPTSTTTTSAPKGTTTTTAAAGSAKAKAQATTTTAKVATKSATAALTAGRPAQAALDLRLASASYPLAAVQATSTTEKGTAIASTTTTTAGKTTVANKTTTANKNGATTTSSVPSATATTTTVPTATSEATQLCNLSGPEQEAYTPNPTWPHGLTPAADDKASAVVLLPNYTDYSVTGKYTPDDRYVLGPAEMTGSIVKSATPYLNSQTDEWEVDLTFTGEGSTLFNKYATAHYECYEENPKDPPYCAQQAIELDATVESAPSIEAATFPGGATINGSTQDPFTSAQASSLATALNYGSLPVRFVAQDINTISPEIGTDSLKAGAIAGAIAVLLVLLYLLIYYRALGLVVLIQILMSGALLYSITTLLSVTSNEALTLSGVIGLIVSVGVTADSCVVYFERLKEEVRSGRTVRTSVEKGFARAFRTILAADFSSFAAALILWWLTVGDVRGFAFFLGLATLLNVVTTYFFTRPLVIMAGRRAALGQGGFLGVSRGLGAGA